MLEVLIIALVLGMGFGAVVVKHLDKFLDINLTCWSLRRHGVDDNEVRKVALKTANRERKNLVLEVLDRILKLFGKA